MTAIVDQAILAEAEPALESARTATSPSARTDQFQRPPTQLGLTSPEEKVETAWAVARRAVGYAAEQVPFAKAARCLVADAHDDAMVLRLAGDYLSFTTVGDNLTDQVNALFMVEDAQRYLPKLARRQAWHNRAGRIIRWLDRRDGSTAAASAPLAKAGRR